MERSRVTGEFSLYRIPYSICYAVGKYRRETPSRHLGQLIQLLVMALLLSSCMLFPPAPTNEQILQAVVASNEMEAEPLELIWEEMQVPQRSRGRAAAVLWVKDKSIQRNFTLAYDKEEKSFYVEDYITLELGEDGVYRDSK